MPTSRRLSNMAARLIVACLIAAGLVVVAGQQPAVAAPSCADVLFIGARGSGQPGPGTTSGWTPTAKDPLGFGGPVSAPPAITAGVVRHRTVAAISVHYAADAVVSKDMLIRPDVYFLGLGNGVAFTESTLRDRAGSCPDERIVLVGYSQGAMVMHRALRNLRASTSARGIVNRLDQAILIGDGDRVPNDTSQLIGPDMPAAAGSAWRGGRSPDRVPRSSPPASACGCSRSATATTWCATTPEPGPHPLYSPTALNSPTPPR